MQIMSKPEFRITLRRGGGALSKARVDVWHGPIGTPTLVATYRFDDPLQANEAVRGQLPPGEYVGVMQCYVEESLNGVFRLALDVDGQVAVQGGGDVNTSPAPHEHARFKSQFDLVVAP